MVKKLPIGIAVALVLFTGSLAKAEDFEEFLKGILSPEEAQVHAQVGGTKATQIAQDVCNSLNSGVTVTEFATQVATSLAGENLPQQQLEARALYSGKVIAAGVVTFCPEHLTQLQQLQPPNLSAP